MGQPTNKQLRTIALIAVVISAVTLMIVLFGKKTIQIEADSTGTIHTGEMKMHLPFVKKAA